MSGKKKQFDVVWKCLIALLVVAVLSQAWIIYDMMKTKSVQGSAPPVLTRASNIQRSPNASPLPPLPSMNPAQNQQLNQALANRGAAPSRQAPNNASANQLMNALQNALASHGGGMMGGGMMGGPMPNGGRGASPRQPLSANPLSPGGGAAMNHPMMGVGGGMMSDPFAEMERMREMMDRMMGGMTGMGGGGMADPFQSMASGFGGGRPAMGASPKIDLDQNDNYVITLDMPGLQKSEIEANVNGRYLTVSGVQRTETKNNGGGFRSMGQSYQQFQTSFALPGPVKSDQMKLDYAGNTLTIRLPRA